MSLINKMLQELDARGSPGGDTVQLHVKSVAREERRLAASVTLIVLAGTLVIAVAGGLGWHYLYKAEPVTALPARPVKVVMAPLPQPVAQVAAPAMAARPAAAEPSTAPLSQAAQLRPLPAPRPESKTAKEEPARTATRVVEQKATGAASRAQAAASSAGGESTAPKRAAPSLVDDGRQQSAGQSAESEYRRGLANLQDGRVSESIAAFERSLQVDPRHEAARQTLVGLLIENRRVDEAIGHLQRGLTLDPRQPALAMLLARLQIERGGSGIETLTRTLPYAAGNGAYQAFLAGALQRQQRHGEAAEQYQAALRNDPEKGVWWMGLGISLQAEKRNAQAADAFQRARASGTLAPELQAFVERKLQQPGR